MNETVQTLAGSIVLFERDYQTVLQQTIDALKTEGFGVLTEIDVQEVMKKKLNEDVRPYKILGACNPALSHRALTAAPEVGLLLPCNVTVRETEDGAVEVAMVDPITLLSLVQNPEVRAVAEEAKARLHRVAASLREA